MKRVTKTYVIISDTQAPYEDSKAYRAVVRFIGERQPDEVVHIGDLMDYPQPSRWNKDTRGEFEGSVVEDSEYAKKRLLAPLRAVYDGPIKVLEGNHDERPRVYIEKYAPAVSDIPGFHFSDLLDFDGFGIEQAPDWYEIAPDWVITHGHLGGIRLSQIGGVTSLNAAKKFGVSIIMGHTHRLAKNSYSLGLGQEVRKILTGVEVGNLMDMKHANYLKKGVGNWQQGFAMAHVDGSHVQVDLIAINHGKFTVEGETYVVQ